MKKYTHKDNEPLGLILMLGSLALFSTTMLLNKVILRNGNLNAFDLFMYSSIVQVGISEIVRNAFYKYSLSVLLQDRTLLIVAFRQLFSVTGWVSLTHLSVILPIGYIQLNQNIIPVLTAVLSYFFLGERASDIESALLLVCFITVSVTGFVKLVGDQE